MVSEWLEKPKIVAKNTRIWVFYGADNQIRTGDLILTKDVLYLLSHISKTLPPEPSAEQRSCERHERSEYISKSLSIIYCFAIVVNYLLAILLQIAKQARFIFEETCGIIIGADNE